MLRVPSLNLPKVLPHPEAIRSFAGNLPGYDPDLWEIHYQVSRYLRNVREDHLAIRYKDILRNMRALINRERDKIPVQSFLSSWYWFRKEHQTRLEFALRGLSPPGPAPFGVVFNNEAAGAPIRPKHPNTGDVLYRYDKRTHLGKLAHEGQIRVRPASDFQKMENDAA